MTGGRCGIGSTLRRISTDGGRIVEFSYFYRSIRFVVARRVPVASTNSFTCAIAKQNWKGDSFDHC